MFKIGQNSIVPKEMEMVFFATKVIKESQKVTFDDPGIIKPNHKLIISLVAN